MTDTRAREHSRDDVFDRFVRAVETLCGTMTRVPPGSLKMHAAITKFFVVFGRDLYGFSLACRGETTGDDELKLELHESTTDRFASITIRSARRCFLPLWRWGIVNVDPFTN